MNRRDRELLKLVMETHSGSFTYRGQFEGFARDVLADLPEDPADVAVYVSDPLPRCKHGGCLRDGGGELLEPECGCRGLPWPDPTPAQLVDPVFGAIWNAIRTWDIHVPRVDGDGMRSGATGNHARAIFDALPKVREERYTRVLHALAQILTDSLDGGLTPEDAEALLRRLLCE